MQIKDEYILKEYGSDAVVLSDDPTHTAVIELNETGIALWKAIKDGKDPVKALTDIYDVDEATAKADADAFIKKLRNAAILEDR